MQEFRVSHGKACECEVDADSTKFCLRSHQEDHSSHAFCGSLHIILPIRANSARQKRQYYPVNL